MIKRKNNIFTPILAFLLFVTACNCNFTDWVKSGEPQNTAPGSNSNLTIATNSGKNVSDSNSGNLSDKPLNAEEKTGISECDEFIAYVEQNSEEIGKDSMIVRGIVEYYKQMIYSKLREGVANSNPVEREEFGKQCKLALEKIKEQNKQTNNSNSASTAN